MDTEGSAAERRDQVEERASRDMMRLLTADLTDEGDAFLIGALAVALVVLLYPLIGAWAFLSFPIVFAGAVLIRAKRRRRRDWAKGTRAG